MFYPLFAGQPGSAPEKTNHGQCKESLGPSSLPVNGQRVEVADIPRGQIQIALCIRYRGMGYVGITIQITAIEAVVKKTTPAYDKDNLEKVFIYTGTG